MKITSPGSWFRFNRPARPERLTALLALGLLAVLLVLFNGGAWAVLNALRQLREEELGNRLIVAGQTTAASLTSDNYLVLGFRDTQGRLDLDLLRSYRGPSYDALLTVLQRVGTMAGLRSIALITPNGRVVAHSTEPDRFGESWVLLQLDAHEIAGALKGVPSTTPLYQIGEDPHKRAYIPVRAEDGQVIALLRLEASRDYFSGLISLRQTMIILLGISTLVVMTVAWVLYRLMNRVIGAERAISHADRLRSLGTLAAGLAHEIRNPLAVIRLTCEELRMGIFQDKKPSSRSAPPMNPESPEFFASPSPALSSSTPASPPSESTDSTVALLNDIQDEVQRLEGLVEQFLSFARPEASHAALTAATPCDPIAVSRRVVRLFEKSLSGNRIRLETQFPDSSTGRVPLDDKSLSQALLNILRNAVEALPERGGMIRLIVEEKKPSSKDAAAHSSALRKLQISSPDSPQSRTSSPKVQPTFPKPQSSGSPSRSDSFIVIAVSDTGMGMSESVRRQAIDPFFSTKQGGTGLGLALVQNLVSSVRGKVEIDSQPGKGTTVKITLPKIEDKTAALSSYK